MSGTAEPLPDTIGDRAAAVVSAEERSDAVRFIEQVENVGRSLVPEVRPLA